MKLPRLLIQAVICLAVVSSCSTSKRLAYLQDFEVGEVMDVAPVPELKAQVGDLLDISVTCKNPQLALPFNVVGGIINVSLNGVDDASGSTMSSQTPKGYLVDNEGNIDFPVLGTLHIEGKTLSEVKDYIAYLLVDKNYIKDPIVTVNILNFKITMLGETSIGVVPIEGNSINLIDALAQSGGTSAFAKIKDLRVIRTENGKRTMYTVNLKSKDLYNSPVYHLQQNDIVYVMPKANKFEGGIESWLMPFVSIVSAISSISMVYLWVNNFKK